ncbi:MAG: DUF1592 domain-containing protein [Acidobacteria bacterium]|nr:DUF1592 domain-containing protein [Acidobacteriota bacterium]
MRHLLQFWSGLPLLILATAAPVSALAQTSTVSTSQALLNRYCITCHNEKLNTAGLRLDQANLSKVAAEGEVWEKVVKKLRGGAMPPVGAPRPDKKDQNAMVAYLVTSLDGSAAAAPNPGHAPGLHRLNRAEYRNAIRDLLAVDVDEVSLPPDDSGFGFDNIGSVLSVSPLLMERYLSSARKISRTAVGEPLARADFRRYEISSMLDQQERMSDDLPFGSRGGAAIKHMFPLDGDYQFRIRLQRDAGTDIVRGLAESHEVDLRLDGNRLKLFSVGGPSAAAKPAKPGAVPEPADVSLVVRATVQAGSRAVAVTFPSQIMDAEGVIRPDQALASLSAPAVESILIEGPFESKGPGQTASRQKIFTCAPASSTNGEACARQILTQLARRAYRRPVNEDDIQLLLSLFRQGRERAGFQHGISEALRVILVNPNFLFRIESDRAIRSVQGAFPVSDLELASRLSFFLWSSIPDDELLALAEKGKLNEPGAVEKQARRMLADPRAEALVTNFAGQWLLLRSVKMAQPDRGEFPDFDGSLREAFQKELEMFFASMLREDRSLLDLLTADYTFVNERLAKHYGIARIYGSHFRRVKLTDENRWGLLGKAGILTATSYSSRTSPVQRGKWLLENLLATPPPPPPPNVPSLQERNDEGKILSMRQEMEKHRANPACAACHARMDPLGFALENFDAIGRWREASGPENLPVDSSGVLPSGSKFRGPAELSKLLAGDPELFAGAVTEKLLTYALGRGLEYYDATAVRKILRGAAASNFRWSSVIVGIVSSTPFRMRTQAEPAQVAAK